MNRVSAWLKSLSLDQYAAAFDAGDIDWSILGELDHDVLKELGVTSPGHRLRILKSIKSLGLSEAALADEHADFETQLDEGSTPGSGGPAREAERRQVTVMFCDMVGSTALSEALDPEDLRDLVNAFQRCAEEAVQKFGGYVARYMGDGLLAYFGYPRADEHDAARAVQSGLAVVDAVTSLDAGIGRELQARVGIATGLVVIGDLAESGLAKEHTVAGETPNLAARLQSLARPGEVIVADLTRRLTRDLCYFEDLGKEQVRGFSEPVRHWRASTGKPGGAQPESTPGVARPLPLIGREHEVELLTRQWESTRNGDGQVVLLSGPAGIGKTRILEALFDELATTAHTRIRYFCSPYHANSTLHPIIEQLSRAAALANTDPPDARRDKLDSLTNANQAGASEDFVVEAREVLAQLLSIDSHTRAYSSLPTAEQNKERTLDTLVELLGILSTTLPVLMILEDAQWADPTSCELFDMIVERIQDLPVALIVTFREQFEPRWTSFPHVTSLTLNRLGSREADQLIRALCDDRSLPRAVHERIVANADGVPLFIEELTRGTLESGLLTQNEDRLELSGPLPPLAIPATVHDSLMARLDRLDAVKELAQVGAAIGRSFSRTVLQASVDRPVQEVEDGLKRLEDHGLLMRRGRGATATYTFKHALMQEVAYQSLLKSRRQVLHMRIAGVLQAHFPELGERQPEVVARQYTEAGLLSEAASAWLKAAVQGKAMAAYSEARSHAEALLQVSEGLTPGPSQGSYRARANALLGDLESLEGNLEAANNAYERGMAATEDQSLKRDIAARLHRVRETRRADARLMYYVHGGGPLTLLFVNPICYGLALFQPILERLCHDFRVVTVDCRGAGGSDPLVRPYTLTQHADDTLAIIDDLGGEPVIGVGVSRGGNQLFHVASKRPDLLQALVLVDTPFAHSTHRNMAVVMESVHAQAQLDAVAAKDWDTLFDIFARSIYSEPSVRHLTRQFAAGLKALPLETMKSFFDPDPGLDVAALIPSIDCPVLVTHGTHDERVPLAAAHDYVNALKDAALYTFEGKGHVPLFSAPDEFCQALRDFIRARIAP